MDKVDRQLVTNCRQLKMVAGDGRELFAAREEEIRAEIKVPNANQ